jgi:hypothetical protein
LTEPPPDLTDYRDDAEPELVALLFELLAKSRDARPPTARHVARRLEALLAALTAAGDTVETADFLAHHFAQERAELRARIATAREERRLPRPSNGGRGRSRAAWIVVAGALTGLGAAGVFAAIQRPGGAREAPSEKPVTTAPPPQEIAPALEAPDAAYATSPAASTDQAPSPRRPRATSARKQPKSGVPIWENY